MRGMKRSILQWVAAMLAASAFGVGASVPELQECLEGGDLIGNAAHEPEAHRATFVKACLTRGTA